MEKNVVNWFEIPVLDMTRAKKFYETVLDHKLTTISNSNIEMCSFPMSTTGTNTTGALVKDTNTKPSLSGTKVYFSCSDLENTESKVVQCGGKVLTSKTSVGEYGFISIIQDSEGNSVGLHSNK